MQLCTLIRSNANTDVGYENNMSNLTRIILNQVIFVQYKIYLRTLIFITGLLFATANLMAEENYDVAIEIVDNLHSTLLSCMQNAESLGYSGRYDALSPNIQAIFDTPLIAKVILGRYWKGLEQQQQSEFIELFNRLSIATYASRFDGYSGESFNTISVKQLNKGRILVKTELIAPDSDPVKFDYIMHLNSDRWYIISVIANGVNDLSLKRAEYASVIKHQGYKNLISNIEDKIKMYENKEN